MANPDESTLIIGPQPSPSNGRAGPSNRQVTRTRQRQRRFSSRIQKGTRQRTCQRTLNCRNSSRIPLRSMQIQRDPPNPQGGGVGKQNQEERRRTLLPSPPERARNVDASRRPDSVHIKNRQPSRNHNTDTAIGYTSTKRRTNEGSCSRQGSDGPSCSRALCCLCPSKREEDSKGDRRDCERHRGNCPE